MKIKYFVAFFLLLSSSVFGGDIEQDRADDFIALYGLEKAIAQLFVVGIPTDYKNSNDSQDLKEILYDIGVGGVIINNYNVPDYKLIESDRDIAFAKVTNLIRIVKSTSFTRSKYPLLLYVDYESYTYSSVKYPLTPPPSPAVLSSTGSPEHSYYAGKLSGYQLNQLGIDVLLGPVLDLDLSNQGEPNNAISLRSFSDSRRILSFYAEAFIDGLIDSNMLLMTKHYPSYGSVYGNAHNEDSIFVGSRSQLEEDLESFSVLSRHAHGMMTSHLTVTSENRSKPATFNKEFIDYFLKNTDEMKKKVLITDDLSNMKASVNYISGIYNKKGEDLFGTVYAFSALDAYKAGHDLLLFSHITGKKTKKHSDFHIKHLKQSVSKIKEYIEDDNDRLIDFKKRLDKVLYLKEMSRSTSSSPSFDYKAESIFQSSELYKDTDQFFRKVFDSAITKISDGGGKEIQKFSQGDKILLIASKEAVDLYKENFQLDLIDYYVIDRTFNSSRAYNRHKRDILKKIPRYDYVILNVESLDHANIIDYIRLKKQNLLDKLTIFLHASPRTLPPHIFGGVTIYSNYSRNPISFLSDIKIVIGDIRSNPVEYSAFSLSGGNYYDSANSIVTEGYDSDGDKVVYFNTKMEEELYNENILHKAQIEDYKKFLYVKSTSHDKVDKITENGDSKRQKMALYFLFVLLFPVFYLLHYLKKEYNKKYGESFLYVVGKTKSSKFLILLTVLKVLFIFVILAVAFPTFPLFEPIVIGISEQFPWTKAVL